MNFLITIRIRQLNQVDLMSSLLKFNSFEITLYLDPPLDSIINGEIKQLHHFYLV